MASSDTEEGPTQVRWRGKRRSLVFNSSSDEGENKQPITPFASSNAEKALSSGTPTPADSDTGKTEDSEGEGEGEALEQSWEVEQGTTSTYLASPTAERKAQVLSVRELGQPLPKRRCCLPTEPFKPPSTSLCGDVHQDWQNESDAHPWDRILQEEPSVILEVWGSL